MRPCRVRGRTGGTGAMRTAGSRRRIGSIPIPACQHRTLPPRISLRAGSRQVGSRGVGGSRGRTGAPTAPGPGAIPCSRGAPLTPRDGCRRRARAGRVPCHPPGAATGAAGAPPARPRPIAEMGGYARPRGKPPAPAAARRAGITAGMDPGAATRILGASSRFGGFARKAARGRSPIPVSDRDVADARTSAREHALPLGLEGGSAAGGRPRRERNRVGSGTSVLSRRTVVSAKRGGTPAGPARPSRASVRPSTGDRSERRERPGLALARPRVRATEPPARSGTGVET